MEKCTLRIINPNDSLLNYQKSIIIFKSGTIPTIETEYDQTRENTADKLIGVMPFIINSSQLDQSTSIEDLIAYNSNRRYGMSSLNNLGDYLNQFENIYLEVLPETGNLQRLDNKLYGTAYDLKPSFTIGNRNFTVVINGYKGNKIETIGILSADNSENPILDNFYTKLTEVFRRELQDNSGVSSMKLPISTDRLRMALDEVNPISNPILMTRRTLEQLGRNASEVIPDEGYSLSQLKEKYGEHYSWHYSDPFIITNEHPGVFKKEHIGRPIIFYAKKPIKGKSVNDLIIESGMSTSNDVVGIIPLDEGVAYSSVEEMMQKFKYNDGTGNSFYKLPDISNQRRIFIGPDFANRLYRYYQGSQSTITAILGNANIKILNQLSNNKNTQTIDDADNQTITNNLMFQFLYNAFMLKDSNKNAAKIIDDINTIIATDYQSSGGVYISPGIIHRMTLGQPVAKMDGVNEPTNRYVLDNLIVKNIAPEPISVNNLRFSTDPNRINNLFQRTPNDTNTANENHILDQGYISDHFGNKYRNGNKIEGDSQILAEGMNKFGIAFSEVKEVLGQMLLNIAQKDVDLDTSIHRMFDELNSNCK